MIAMRKLSKVIGVSLLATLVSCQDNPSLERRIDGLEAAVDSLQKENEILRGVIAQRDSLIEKTYLDLEERIVVLENFADEQEWGIYNGK